MSDKTIGSGGRPGRGGKTSPSAAARSLAGGSARTSQASREEGRRQEGRDAAKKAAAKKAAPRPKKARREEGRPGQEGTPAAGPEAADRGPPPSPARACAPSPTRTQQPRRLALPRRPSARPARPARLRCPPASRSMTSSSALIQGAQRVLGSDWDARLAGLLATIRRRLSGDYEVDEFGFDRQITEVLTAAIEPFAEGWFRLEVRGVENIPTEGGALLVANHSGTVPIDGIITGYAVHKYSGRQPAPAGRRPGLLPAVRRADGAQGGRHAGVHRGRRAAAHQRRAGGRVARGLQGHRQAVRRAVQAAAVRSRRLRVIGHARPGADRSGLDRRAPRRSTR